MKSERQRQQEAPGPLFLYHFRCADGEGFDVVAPSTDGAHRVLNAERPGIYGEVLRSRRAHRHDLRVYETQSTRAPDVR